MVSSVRSKAAGEHTCKTVPLRLLQCLHWGTKSVNGPPDDTGWTQEGWGQKEPQVFQGAVHLSHCGTKGGSNAGAQQLEGIVHEPLFQVIIDVQKAYGYFDRGIYMGILRGYGLDNNLQRLLQQYWDENKVEPESRKCFGQLFQT